MALRIRRAQQAGVFYFQLCGGAFLREVFSRTISRFLSRLRISMFHRSHSLLMSASIMPLFCWKHERISADYMSRFVTPFNFKSV